MRERALVRERVTEVEPMDDHPLIDSLTYHVMTTCGYVLDMCERFDQEFPNDP